MVDGESQSTMRNKSNRNKLGKATDIIQDDVQSIFQKNFKMKIMLREIANFAGLPYFIPTSIKLTKQKFT